MAVLRESLRCLLGWGFWVWGCGFKLTYVPYLFTYSAVVHCTGLLVQAAYFVSCFVPVYGVLEDGKYRCCVDRESVCACVLESALHVAFAVHVPCFDFHLIPLRVECCCSNAANVAAAAGGPPSSHCRAVSDQAVGVTTVLL